MDNILHLHKKNIVNAVVHVGGKQVNIVSLHIEQVYGDHHHFTLRLDYDVAGKTFLHDPNVIKLRS